MTPPLYAFVHNTRPDPNERLENALLYRALRRRLGDRMVECARVDHVPASARAVFGRISPERLHLGRARGPVVYPAPDQLHLPYWRDPKFLAAAGRRFAVHDLAAAALAVAERHERGEAAFVKSTQTKLFRRLLPPGTSLTEALGPLIYSLTDGAGVMVQDAVAFQDEYRIFIVAGRIVTGAGCIRDRTPAENRARFDPVLEPVLGGGRPRRDPAKVRAYRAFAQAFARGRSDLTCTLDLGLIDGRIAVVEMNPLYLGRVGFYACDIQALTDAVLDQIAEATGHAEPSRTVAPAA